MRYAKIENELILQIERVGNHRGESLIVNGKKKSSNTTEQHYIDAGWKKEVIPVIPDGKVITNKLIVDDTTFTYELRNKTAEELQAESDQTELDTEISSSPLNGITFAQASSYIDDNVTDLASAKEVLKKMASAILILNKMIAVEKLSEPIE